jgi:hypothetical protein
MEYIGYFVKLAVILMSFVVCACLTLMVLRGRRIPECYSCGTRKVRPSQPDGLFDLVGLSFLIYPFRCSGCRERFHAFVLFGASGRRRQRVVKIVFRLRSSSALRVSIRVVDIATAPKALPGVEKLAIQ